MVPVAAQTDTLHLLTITSTFTVAIQNPGDHPIGPCTIFQTKT